MYDNNQIKDFFQNIKSGLRHRLASIHWKIEEMFPLQLSSCTTAGPNTQPSESQQTHKQKYCLKNQNQTNRFQASLLSELISKVFIIMMIPWKKTRSIDRVLADKIIKTDIFCAYCI